MSEYNRKINVNIKLDMNYGVKGTDDTFILKLFDRTLCLIFLR